MNNIRKFIYPLTVTCMLLLLISGCKKHETYTVTFNANGGTGTLDSSFVKVDSNTGAADPTGHISREYYNFTGWNTAADGTGTAYAVGDPVPMTDDVVLYAQWALSNVGAAVNKINEAAKSLATPPDDPSKLKDPLSLKMERKFNDLDVKDTFASMYLSDQFLRSYSPKVVKDAYNSVLQAVPSLIKRNNSEALIKALVKRIITTNSQIDPLEVGTFVDMEKSLAETKLKQLQSDLAMAASLKGSK